MKTTVKKITDCYKALGEIKVTKLEVSEIIKIVKLRKSMRTIFEDYENFTKDAEEKLRYVGIEEDEKNRSEFIKKWNKDHSYVPSSNEEKSLENLSKFFEKLNIVKDEELNREVEIDIEKLNEESIINIIVENSWQLQKVEEISIICN